MRWPGFASGFAEGGYVSSLRAKGEPAVRSGLEGGTLVAHFITDYAVYGAAPLLLPRGSLIYLVSRARFERIFLSLFLSLLMPP